VRLCREELTRQDALHPPLQRAQVLPFAQARIATLRKGEVKGQAKAANSLKEQPNLSGMPAAVRITLLLDSNPKSPTNAVTGERTLEPPLAFQTVARLNLADISNTSGSGADTASAATDGGQDAATPGGGAN
jgi:hypothetical protein